MDHIGKNTENHYKALITTTIPKATRATGSKNETDRSGRLKTLGARKTEPITSKIQPAGLLPASRTIPTINRIIGHEKRM